MSLSAFIKFGVAFVLGAVAATGVAELVRPDMVESRLIQGEVLDIVNDGSVVCMFVEEQGAPDCFETVGRLDPPPPVGSTISAVTVLVPLEPSSPANVRRIASIRTLPEAQSD
jgi:hypothetical protein